MILKISKHLYQKAEKILHEFKILNVENRFKISTIENLGLNGHYIENTTLRIFFLSNKRSDKYCQE